LVRTIRADIRKHRPNKTTQARALRANDTEEEYRLWSDLRARRLNGFKFARQVPLGPFIVDFLCREAHLVVEIDGFHHANSAFDQRRTEWLNARGYSVLRFWNQEVTRERRSVLETILAALDGRLDAIGEPSSFYSPAINIKSREQQP
jgi:very-short-patch-repair endonuclease